jgi:hypothetical protein
MSNMKDRSIDIANRAKEIFDQLPITGEGSNAFNEGVFQGIQMGLRNIDQQTIREMIPELEWEYGEGSSFFQLHCVTMFGTYEIVDNMGEWEVVLHTFDENVPLIDPYTLEGAKEICQKDYEDRVLKCLGFEPKNEEG